MIRNPLLDTEFLRLLDAYPHRDVYARITSLTWSELPIECIEGKVTGGSISVDGTSAVRRTCNLTIVAEEVNINNFYWCLTHKFQVEIGLKNSIKDKYLTDHPEYMTYPEIIWFKQGIFVITTFNTTFNVTNYTVSISGKDKMCLLNGDIGGNLTATTDFGSMDIYDTRYTVAKIENESMYQAHKYYIYDPTKVYFDTQTMKWQDGYVLADGPWDRYTTYYNQESDYSNKKIPIKEILREAIHTYASEPYHKIVINDLEDTALELLEYRNENDPLYVAYEQDVQESRAVYYDGTVEVICVDTGETVTLATIPVYDNFVEGFQENATQVKFRLDGPIYTIVKLEYGDVAGFRSTDLIYAGDLIGNVGESFTSILDKIKNMLGEFEYFYNLEGYFVFQRKRTYSDVSWTPIVKGFQGQDDIYVADAVYTSSTVYSLTNNLLITAFNNNPNIANLKNDYAIHGKRKTLSGAEIPIHYRFAIDHKPMRYQAFPISAEQSRFLTTNFPESFPYDMEHHSDNAKNKYQREIKTYITEDYIIDQVNDVNRVVVDWREILYQMAYDYHKYHEWDDFLYYVELYNPQFLGGVTGYEIYYTDILSFWRDLYNPNIKPVNAYDGGYYNETITYTRDDKGNIVNDGTYETDMIQNWVDYKEKQYDFECNYFLPSSMIENKAEQIIKIENTMIYLRGDDNNKHQIKWILQTDLDENEYVKFDYEIHRLQKISAATAKGTMITTEPISCDYSLVDNAIQYETLSTSATQKAIQLASHYYRWPEQDNTAHYYWEDLADNFKDVQLTGNYDNLQTSSNTVYYKIRGIYTNENGEKYYTKWSNLLGVTARSRSTLGTSDKTPILVERYISHIEPYPHNATDQIKTTDYKTYLSNFNDTYAYWNKIIYEDPSQINFWIDFLDTDGELGKYSVSQIGDRTKAINDDKVTAIYFKEIPNVIYVASGEELDQDNLNPGYKYIRIPTAFIHSFVLSAQGKSAKEKLDELLYDFSYCTQNVTITCVPIYYLDVNTRIFVFDKKSNINGEYIVEKLTVPLTYNGTMSITAHKAVERLY